MNVEIIKARVINEDGTVKRHNRMRVAAYCRVSTEDEDQIKSYDSMVKHYTDYIQKNTDWQFAGVYADRGTTGTSVNKRPEFRRLIDDCMNGKIDMIIAKSLSRFARNTLDTIKYVRDLKDKGIAIYFENEHINTLKDGEFLMTILSSVAQQEVENTSSNVKKGLAMKMRRGELVGFHKCLGYVYDPITKQISVNEEEAEIVRYIFEQYASGIGSTVIARELNAKGLRTIKGNPWSISAVMCVIKNEKYTGDLLMGKTFTVDPISKRRLKNEGEQDQYFVKNHHEPIITRELYDRANEIRKLRGTPYKQDAAKLKRKYCRQYAFSSMLQCGFCGGTLSRRTWHSSSKYHKIIWLCSVSSKKSKKYCAHSKAVEESIIEKAFLESYRLMCSDDKSVLDEFLKKVEKTLQNNESKKKYDKAYRKSGELDVKRKKLLESYLQGVIAPDIYKQMDQKYEAEVAELKQEIYNNELRLVDENETRKRLEVFKKTLSDNSIQEEFDRNIFESIISKVIVGGYDENGSIDPYKLSFIYKTGFENNIDNVKKKYRMIEKGNDSELLSKDSAKNNELSQNIDNSHVETIVLIERIIKAKDHVQVGIDAEEYYRIKDSEKKTE